MLADLYIPRLSNDMKIAVQKNHLGGQILYRRLDPPKKRRRRHPMNQLRMITRLLQLRAFLAERCASEIRFLRSEQNIKLEQTSLSKKSNLDNFIY